MEMSPDAIEALITGFSIVLSAVIFKYIEVYAGWVRSRSDITAAAGSVERLVTQLKQAEQNLLEASRE